MIVIDQDVNTRESESYFSLSHQNQNVLHRCWNATGKCQIDQALLGFKLFSSSTPAEQDLPRSQTQDTCVQN